jgi:hypothetical protein
LSALSFSNLFSNNSNNYNRLTTNTSLLGFNKSPLCSDLQSENNDDKQNDNNSIGISSNMSEYQSGISTPKSNFSIKNISGVAAQNKKSTFIKDGGKRFS